MKQCVNCGMSFGDTVTTCRFCGKAVKPVAAAPKPAPKPAPEYTECIQCHFKQAPGTEKCRFCGGICKVVNPATPAEQQKDEGDKTLTGGNKRELLKAQATELGLTFAANIRTEKLEEMIVAALKAKDEPEQPATPALEDCTEEELRAVATELGIEIAEGDTKDTLIQKINEFTPNTNGENTDDNPGNNEADSTSSEGSDTPVNNN